MTGGCLVSQQHSFRACRAAPDQLEPAGSTATACQGVGVRHSSAQREIEGGGLALRNALLDLYAAVRAAAAPCGAGSGSPGGGYPSRGVDSAGAGGGEDGARCAEEEAWPWFPDMGGQGGGWDWGSGLWGEGGEGLEDWALLLDPDRSARAQGEMPT